MFEQPVESPLVTDNVIRCGEHPPGIGELPCREAVAFMLERLGIVADRQPESAYKKSKPVGLIEVLLPDDECQRGRTGGNGLAGLHDQAMRSLELWLHSPPDRIVSPVNRIASEVTPRPIHLLEICHGVSQWNRLPAARTIQAGDFQLGNDEFSVGPAPASAGEAVVRQNVQGDGPDVLDVGGADDRVVIPFWVLPAAE